VCQRHFRQVFCPYLVYFDEVIELKFESCSSYDFAFEQMEGKKERIKIVTNITFYRQINSLWKMVYILPT
jgi:hypothetical protein